MVSKGRSAIIRCPIQVREASNLSHHQFSPSVRQAHRQAYGIGDRLLCRSGMVLQWAPVRNGCGKHMNALGQQLKVHESSAFDCEQMAIFLYGFMSSVKTLPATQSRLKVLNSTLSCSSRISRVVIVTNAGSMSRKDELRSELS